MKKSGSQKSGIMLSQSGHYKAEPIPQQPSISIRPASGRQNSPVQHYPHKDLARSRSENTFPQRQPERVVYSQPKPIPTVVSQYYHVPQGYQQNVVRGPHTPKIVFTTSTPSNIKKNYRIIQFAQPQNL